MVDQKLEVVADIGYSSMLQIRYIEALREQALRFEVRENWQTDLKIDELVKVATHPGWEGDTFVSQDTNEIEIVRWNPPQHIRVGGMGGVSARVAALDPESAYLRLAELKEHILPSTDKDDGKVRVNFWWLSPHGPRQAIRKLAVPEWADIESNYAASTRQALAGLYNGFKPDAGGKLILWSGVAGTGKTFALRALAREWRDWCAVHYVIDTDKFFQDQAAYLVDVLLGEEEEVPPHHPAGSGESANPQWRLLVFEDAGELLTKDAKERVGQGLSRLLNVCDGLVGQGLRVLLLITTNEELGNLHPAVIRPGRCTSRVEFEGLSANEAQQWFVHQGVDWTRLGDKNTLADLYAQLEDRELRAPVKQGIGFNGSSG